MKGRIEKPWPLKKKKEKEKKGKKPQTDNKVNMLTQFTMKGRTETQDPI